MRADGSHVRRLTGRALVLASNGFRCSIFGTSHADVLHGTTGQDVICGLGGNDTIVGAASSDTLDGGPGNDLIVAGPGDRPGLRRSPDRTRSGRSTAPATRSTAAPAVTRRTPIPATGRRSSRSSTSEGRGGRARAAAASPPGSRSGERSGPPRPGTSTFGRMSRFHRSRGRAAIIATTSGRSASRPASSPRPRSALTRTPVLDAVVGKNDALTIGLFFPDGTPVTTLEPGTYTVVVHDSRRSTTSTSRATPTRPSTSGLKSTSLATNPSRSPSGPTPTTPTPASRTGR